MFFFFFVQYSKHTCFKTFKFMLVKHVCWLTEHSGRVHLILGADHQNHQKIDTKSPSTNTQQGNLSEDCVCMFMLTNMQPPSPSETNKDGSSQGREFVSLNSPPKTLFKIELKYIPRESPFKLMRSATNINPSMSPHVSLWLYLHPGVAKLGG